MAADKISSLIDDKVFDDFQKLNDQLTTNRDVFLAAIDAAAKYNAEIGKANTIADFNKATADATKGLVDLNAAEQNLIPTQKAVQTNIEGIVAAMKSKAATDENAIRVLNDVSGSIDSNVKSLLQQKAQLKEVDAALKELNKTERVTAQGKNDQLSKSRELVRQQLELKNSIAQISLVLKQQIKDNQATAESNDQLTARLNLLRKAYNSLSAEEQNNAAIGGVLLKNIQDLSAKTTEANESQGKYNDSVGRYEDKIKSAISAYVPYGNQLVKGIDLLKDNNKETEGASSTLGVLATRFAGFTIAGFAVAIAGATYYLQQFRDTGNKTEQILGGLKNQFSNFGKNVSEGFSSKNGILGVLTNPLSLFSGNIDAGKQGVEATKALQNVKNLNEVNDQLVLKQQAQADQLRAQAKNKDTSDAERIKKLKEAESIETGIIEMQKDNAKANINAAIQSSDAVKKLTANQKELLSTGSEGAIRYANDLVKTGKLTQTGYALLMQGYQKETQTLNAANIKLIRQQNDEARINTKGAKELNTEELENARAKLKEQQSIAKLVLDDEKQSFDARLAALQVFVKRSNDLIDNEQAIANKKPGITAIGKDTNATNARTAKGNLSREAINETEKIQKEINASVKKSQDDLLKSLSAADKAYADDFINSQNDQLEAIEKEKSDALSELADQYEKGKIKTKQYNDQLYAIEAEASGRRIDLQIATLEKIINAQVAQVALGDPNAAKGLQSNANALAKLKGQRTELSTKNVLQRTKSDDPEKKRQELVSVEAKTSLELIGIAKNYNESVLQAAEARYQKEAQLLSEQIDREKAAVQNGVGTARDKAAKLAQIDAEAANGKKQIQAKENELKHKAAVADKIAAEAAILINTAVAVTKVTAETGLLGLLTGVPAVIALGALQAAAVAGAPIPAYAVGTNSAIGGKSLVGEKGAELIIDPTGAAYLTPNSATIMDVQKGSKVLTNAETMRIMAKPDTIQYVGGQAVDISALVEQQKITNKLLGNKQAQRPGIHRTHDEAYLRRNKLIN